MTETFAEVIKLIVLLGGACVIKAWRDKWGILWATKKAAADHLDLGRSKVLQRLQGEFLALSVSAKRWWHWVGFVMSVWIAFWSVWLIRDLSWRFIIWIPFIGACWWLLFDYMLNKFRGLPANHIGDSDIEKKLGSKIMKIKFYLAAVFLILTCLIALV